METKVRKQKSGDQLAAGDWLAPGMLLDRAAEVLFAHAYPAAADGSRDNDGTHVQLVMREQGHQTTYTDVVSGANLFDLASDEELAGYREAVERARKIADIRAYADWLEANADLPMPYGLGGQQDVAADNATPADVAKVRAFAERFGATLRELADRTVAYHRIGSVGYDLIAWHRNGRPSEPAPDAAAAADVVPVPAEDATLTPHPAESSFAPAMTMTDAPDPMFPEGEPRCGARTPGGPCALRSGHIELCDPEPVPF